MRSLVPEPPSRRLRIFAFDPSIAGRYETSDIGEVTTHLLWEDTRPGPIGEYLEVLDVDPASGVFYEPVDLSHPWLLAQDGLPPSESSPQFHQQMVYAVAMTTIGHFERALGRPIFWSTHSPSSGEPEYVQRLRIYPHALRDRNAYYSPDKKALLFGYFQVDSRDAFNTPGTIVYTCLSQDIIAHETTHALLDGMRPLFNDISNRDMRAFHEAFADIVALFQHFSYPEVLRSQIKSTRGDLATENLLSQLAQEFGRASGRGSALRDALGAVDPKTGTWRPHLPDVRALDVTFQAHERGAILVAAVFGAFLKVYRARTRDLFRLASEGTGILREGDLSHDLSNRLSAEAANCAQQVLHMCIRALDYTAPVGITFGHYLRAIVTADFDLNPEDVSGYRLAFLDSFRQWGIYPAGMRSISLKSLLWPSFDHGKDSYNDHVVESGLRELAWAMGLWTSERSREDTWRQVPRRAKAVREWLQSDAGRPLLPALGLVLDDAPATVFRTEAGIPAIEVRSVRTAVRRSPKGGATVSDLVVEITQRRRGYFDRSKQHEHDQGNGSENIPDFVYQSGCTLLIDLANMQLRRVIRSPGTVADEAELERVRRFFIGGGLQPLNAFAPATAQISAREPFAMLHRNQED